MSLFMLLNPGKGLSCLASPGKTQNHRNSLCFLSKLFFNPYLHMNRMLYKLLETNPGKTERYP